MPAFNFTATITKYPSGEIINVIERTKSTRLIAQLDNLNPPLPYKLEIRTANNREGKETTTVFVVNTEDAPETILDIISKIKKGVEFNPYYISFNMIINTKVKLKLMSATAIDSRNKVAISQEVDQGEPFLLFGMANTGRYHQNGYNLAMFRDKFYLVNVYDHHMFLHQHISEKPAVQFLTDFINRELNWRI